MLWILMFVFVAHGETPDLNLHCRVTLASPTGAAVELSRDCGVHIGKSNLIETAPCSIEFGKYALWAKIENIIESQGSPHSRPYLTMELISVRGKSETAVTGVPTISSWSSALETDFNSKAMHAKLVGYQYIDHEYKGKKISRENYECRLEEVRPR